MKRSLLIGGSVAIVALVGIAIGTTRIAWNADRARIDAAVRADRIQRDLEAAHDALADGLAAHHTLQQHTDSADAELAKAKAAARRTSASLTAFRDSIAQLPAPASASDSVERLTAYLAVVSSDLIAKDAALAKSDSVIKSLRNETALLHGAVTSALRRVDSTATDHAKYVMDTKDWGPPPSLFAKVRNTSIGLGVGYLIGKATR